MTCINSIKEAIGMNRAVEDRTRSESPRIRANSMAHNTHKKTLYPLKELNLEKSNDILFEEANTLRHFIHRYLKIWD